MTNLAFLALGLMLGAAADGPKVRTALAQRRARRGRPKRRDKPTLTIYLPPAEKATGRPSWSVPAAVTAGWRSGHEGKDPAGVAESSRRRRLRARAIAWRPLSSSGSAAGRPAGPPHRPQPGEGVERRSEAHRHLGLFGGRPPGLDGGHALRRRQGRRRRPHRARRLPPRLRHPLLPGHHAGPPTPTWARGRTCSATSRTRSWSTSLCNEKQVTAQDAADVPVPHQRRHAPCRRRTACCSTWRCARRRCRRSCTFTRRAARRRSGGRTRCCRPGRTGWPPG